MSVIREIRCLPEGRVYIGVVMSFTDIEAELEKLPPDQLRLLALKSWEVYRSKESQGSAFEVCDEDDPALLAAVDEAAFQADKDPARGCGADDVRARLRQWISK
jgi:hypothetical protein